MKVVQAMETDSNSLQIDNILMVSDDTHVSFDDDIRQALLDHAEADDPSVSQPSLQPCLSRPLATLFFLNGVSLALPTTAFLYILNARVQMPLHLLSVYGAVAFVPFSFKPIYALGPRHHRMIGCLLLAHAVALLLTLYAVRPGAVGACLLFGFARGCTCAWPEFLLGLELLAQASKSTVAPNTTTNAAGLFRAQASAASSNNTTAALFQAQAATARNLGSLGAHLAATCYMSTQTSVNEMNVSVLVKATAVLTVVAACVAFGSKINSTRSEFPRAAQVDTSSVVSYYQRWERSDDANVSPSSSSIQLQQQSTTTTKYMLLCQNNKSITMVICLQFSVVLLALRDPITQSTASWFYNTCFGICIACLCAAACSHQATHITVAGTFLILRHALPTASYLMDSFLYDLFQASPFVLQFLSLVDMGVLTVASYSYGRVWSKWSQGTELRVLIAITTIMAGVWSLMQLVIANCVPHQTSLVKQVVIVLLIKLVGGILAEWKFLPDVVFATVAARKIEVRDSADNNTFVNEESEADDVNSPRQLPVDHRTQKDDQFGAGVRYGSLIACIDFGGQLAMILTVPLVKALGIQRENGWSHLDRLIEVASLLTVMSSGLVTLLWKN
jgi:hypothetical protein